MKIDVPKLPEEGKWFDDEGAASLYHLEFPLCQFQDVIQIHLFVNKVSGDLLARGELVTKVHIQCVRCLNDFIYPINIKEFTFCEPIKNRPIIDLTEPIKEDILLTLPSKPLCRKDCKGLCTKCGQDLNDKKCGCKKETKNLRLSDLDKLKFD